MVTTIGSLANVPNPGAPIASAWAQDVTRLGIHRFATKAALDAATWPGLADGMFAIALDTSKLWKRQGGAWVGALVGPWVAVAAFTNGWLAYGAPMHVPAYRYEGGGEVVRIRGAIKSGNLGQQAFVLPAGYRPPGDLFIASISGGSALGRLDITAAGVVQPTGGTNAFFSIECTFPIT